MYLALIAGTMTVGAVTNIFETNAFGYFVEARAQRWLAGMESEGLTYLSRPDARNCAFEALVRTAWADGDLDEREQLYFQAFLMRPYVEELNDIATTEDSNWSHLQPEARRNYTEWLRDGQDSEADFACLLHPASGRRSGK